MWPLDELDFLQEYREDNRIEAKRAQGGLPHSLWETYSAFANTLGGVILLGVAEGADKSLYSVPLFDPQELVDEFWDMVNDPTVVSANILQPEDVGAAGKTPLWPSSFPGQRRNTALSTSAATPTRAPTTAGARGTGAVPATRWRLCCKIKRDK